MLNLDLRTIILMSGILAVLLAVVMLSVRLSHGKTLKGLGQWAVAPLLVSVATFLLGARGQIPDFISILGANVLLLAGVLLFHFGTRSFFELRPSYRFWLPIMLLALPLLATGPCLITAEQSLINGFFDAVTPLLIQQVSEELGVTSTTGTVPTTGGTTGFPTSPI